MRISINLSIITKGTFDVDQTFEEVKFERIVRILYMLVRTLKLKYHQTDTDPKH